MIEEISIRGLGVIDEATIRPGAGFTVLTGETGAGKTMVLSALAMLMGDKPQPSLVRGERARVEGRWLLAAQEGAAGLRAVRAVEDAGGECEDGEVILARVVPREGRARAFAGGASVPTAALGEIADGLVAVHGQSEQVRIRQSAKQREVLDAFAGSAVAGPRSRYRALHAHYLQVLAELQERTEGEAARAAEAELLRQQLAEIESVAPQTGEALALRAEEERLGNVEELAAACQSAHQALSDDDGGDDALGRVGAAARLLDQAGAHDAEVAQLAVRVREAAALLADAAADVASYAASLEGDPARLSWVQQRRATLTRLARRHGGDVDELLEWSQRAGRRLADLDGDDDRIDELAAERDELVGVLAELAGQLSESRTAAAERLSAAVTGELAALAMPGAAMRIDVGRVPDEHGLCIDGMRWAFGPEGVDQVTFLLAPHPGAAPAPVGQGASGGELSRVMLALEVALAGVDATPTMVFDEVDAGVGGRAAVEVGRRLARLARSTQVIVVTHLPQVAAFADTHLVVRKDSSGAVTSSSVHTVAGEERRRELARMLAGLDSSDHALAHADELLEMGAAESAAGRAAAR